MRARRRAGDDHAGWNRDRGHRRRASTRRARTGPMAPGRMQDDPASGVPAGAGAARVAVVLSGAAHGAEAAPVTGPPLAAAGPSRRGASGVRTGAARRVTPGAGGETRRRGPCGRGEEFGNRGAGDDMQPPTHPTPAWDGARDCVTRRISRIITRGLWGGGRRRGPQGVRQTGRAGDLRHIALPHRRPRRETRRQPGYRAANWRPNCSGASCGHRGALRGAGGPREAARTGMV